MMFNTCNPLNLSAKNARVSRKFITMIALVLVIVEITLMILVRFSIESKRKITLKRNLVWKFVESKIRSLFINLQKLKMPYFIKNHQQNNRIVMQRQVE
jgi:hypothetical protein